MECYACDNQATRQCKRCSRVYCEVHGDDQCAECLRPSSALPSFNLYRGSLLALLVGTAVSLWLLVRPTGQGDSEEITLALTPTAVAEAVSNTPTEASDDETGTPETPDATVEKGTKTPGPTKTDTLKPTPTRTPQTYIVQEGDTLIEIAEQFAPPGMEPFEYAAAIALLNGIGGDEGTIDVGQELLLP